MMSIPLAVVGATGLVGRKFLQVLQERQWARDNPLFLFASSRSAGQKFNIFEKDLRVQELREGEIRKLPEEGIAFFSAGAEIAQKFAPLFEEQGWWVVDNSSAFRMAEDKALVVPEINLFSMEGKSRIIANPNCSTIQLVMALFPLHKQFGLKAVVVSTYQSVSGKGKDGMDQLLKEIQEFSFEKESQPGPAFPTSILRSPLPHIDPFEESGYSREELKIIYETRKILGFDLKISVTAVRVGVFYSHSESVYAVFERAFSVAEARKTLESFPGIRVLDDPLAGKYPLAWEARDKDEVFVGRIRKDLFNDHALNFWVVSDNLRKGAATNALAIAEALIKRPLSVT